jgi:hypothetical protein
LRLEICNDYNREIGLAGNQKNEVKMTPTKIMKFFVTAFAAIGFAITLSACSPEIGSKEWCDQIKEKPKGDVTANEAKDFAKHCILK